MRLNKLTVFQHGFQIVVILVYSDNAESERMRQPVHEKRNSKTIWITCCLSYFFLQEPIVFVSTLSFGNRMLLFSASQTDDVFDCPHWRLIFDGYQRKLDFTLYRFCLLLLIMEWLFKSFSRWVVAVNWVLPSKEYFYLKWAFNINWPK